MEDYLILERCGEGTYGFVYKALQRSTGSVVALKQVTNVAKEDGTPVEVKYLSHLKNSSNIVQLKDYFYSEDGDHLFLVMEFISRDLWRIISNPSYTLNLGQIKNITRQVLESVYQCHLKGVMHRDIKPANLLIDNDGGLKLTDFGLSTFIRKLNSNSISSISTTGEGGGGSNIINSCNDQSSVILSSNVVSLYYRPPELLLGSTCYGGEIDIWSIGCILMEMVGNCYLFAGANETEQLELIFKKFGIPNELNWPGVTQFKDYFKLVSTFPHYHQKSLLDSFPQLQFIPNLLDLASKMLILDPKVRINSFQALNHPWFTTNDNLLDHLVPSSKTFIEDCLKVFSSQLNVNNNNNKNNNILRSDNLIIPFPNNHLQPISQPTQTPFRHTNNNSHQLQQQHQQQVKHLYPHLSNNHNNIINNNNNTLYSTPITAQTNLNSNKKNIFSNQITHQVVPKPHLVYQVQTQPQQIFSQVSLLEHNNNNNANNTNNNVEYLYYPITLNENSNNNNSSNEGTYYVSHLKPNNNHVYNNNNNSNITNNNNNCLINNLVSPHFINYNNNSKYENPPSLSSSTSSTYNPYHHNQVQQQQQISSSYSPVHYYDMDYEESDYESDEYEQDNYNFHSTSTTTTTGVNNKYQIYYNNQQQLHHQLHLQQQHQTNHQPYILPSVQHLYPQIFQNQQALHNNINNNNQSLYLIQQQQPTQQLQPIQQLQSIHGLNNHHIPLFQFSTIQPPNSNMNSTNIVLNNSSTVSTNLGNNSANSKCYPTLSSYFQPGHSQNPIIIN